MVCCTVGFVQNHSFQPFFDVPFLAALDKKRRGRMIKSIATVCGNLNMCYFIL